MKVAFPILLFLILLSIFAMVFTGSSSGFGEGVMYSDPLHTTAEGWFDAGGRQIAYTNFTLVSGLEDGVIQQQVVGGDPSNLDPAQPSLFGGNAGLGVYYWNNRTDHRYNLAGSMYTLYDTPYGSNSGAGGIFSFFVNTNIGFLVVIGIIVTISAVVGLHILGFGISDVSVKNIVTGGVMVGLFMVCSAACYSFIVAIPIVGSVFYFLLTAIYTFDVVGSLV